MTTFETFNFAIMILILISANCLYVVNRVFEMMLSTRRNLFGGLMYALKAAGKADNLIRKRISYEEYALSDNGAWLLAVVEADHLNGSIIEKYTSFEKAYESYLKGIESASLSVNIFNSIFRFKYYLNLYKKYSPKFFIDLYRNAPYNIYIDDERVPTSKKTKYFIVRNFDELIDTIKLHGLPAFVSFDHDLGDNIPNGLDCAKYIVDRCIKENRPVPDFNVHSANPAGAENIRCFMTSAKKHVTLQA